MHRVDPIYLEHQLKRWMRPDAHRFVRPDWRRFVRPEFQAGHPFALYERKYSPEQPRVPAGSREGGRWADGTPPSSPSGAETTDLSAASRKGGRGHHYVATAEVNKRNVSDEAKRVFDKETTGPLYDFRNNKWDKDHRAYNVAVGEALDDYLKKAGTPPKVERDGRLRPGPKYPTKTRGKSRCAGNIGARRGVKIAMSAAACMTSTPSS
jgi:hypothetical protein